MSVDFFEFQFHPFGIVSFALARTNGFANQLRQRFAEDPRLVQPFAERRFVGRLGERRPIENEHGEPTRECRPDENDGSKTPSIRHRRTSAGS